MSKWARGERRALYARFIAVNDAAFNAAASANGFGAGDGTNTLPAASRVTIEHAQGGSSRCWPKYCSWLEKKCAPRRLSYRHSTSKWCVMPLKWVANNWKTLTRRPTA